MEISDKYGKSSENPEKGIFNYFWYGWIKNWLYKVEFAMNNLNNLFRRSKEWK